MSAVNIAVLAGARVGLMLTDSLSYRGRTVAGYGAKAVTIPHAQAIVASRGCVTACVWAASVAACLGSFDEIVDKWPGALRADWNAVLALGVPGPLEILALGWSNKRQQIIGLWLCNEGDGGPAFEAIELEKWFAPALDEYPLRIAGQNPCSDEADYLLRVMEEQRVRKPKIADAETEIIGGHAVLTTISQHEITQRILRRWE